MIMHSLTNTRMLGVLLAIEVACERPDFPFGICYHVSKASVYGGISPDPWLHSAFHYLGLDKHYPVPHPGYTSNETAFDQSCSYERWSGPYGENRRHLLSLLIRLAAGESIGPADVAWPHPPKE